MQRFICLFHKSNQIQHGLSNVFIVANFHHFARKKAQQHQGFFWWKRPLKSSDFNFLFIYLFIKKIGRFVH
jgi:hypothetical protein